MNSTNYIIILAFHMLGILFVSTGRSEDWAPGERELFNQFQTLRSEGRYSAAALIAEKWVRLCEQAYGSSARDTMVAINALCAAYIDAGNFDLAEPQLRRCLEVMERRSKTDHPDLEAVRKNLGFVYERLAFSLRERGEYSEAVQYLLGALEQYEQISSAANSLIGRPLNDLAVVQVELGELEAAESNASRALEVTEALQPSQEMDVAACHNTLFLVYARLGDLYKAWTHLNECLDLLKGKLELSDPSIATVRSNAGTLCMLMGRHEEALEHLMISLESRKNQLPGNEFEVAKSHGALGTLYLEMRNYTEAEKHLLLSLEMGRSVLPPNHPDLALAYCNVGMCEASNGDYDAAETNLSHALEIRRSALPDNHSDLAISIENLCGCLCAAGRVKEATHKLGEAISIRRANWETTLSFTSDEEREGYLDTFVPFNLPGTLESGSLVAASSLWSKGSLLEASLQDKRAALASDADPELAGLLRQTEDLKDQLRQASLEGNKAELSEAQIQDLEGQLDALQKTIARKVSGYGNLRRSLQVSIEQVQAAIPASSVLLDFIHYSHHLGKDDWEKRYAAVVVRPGAEPQFIPLGEADTLDALITRHREISGTDPDKANVEELNPVLHKLCRDLHQVIAAPIEAALPAGTKELILCPDAQLHFLAFASLLDDQDQFWAEKFSLRHVATARDLLKLPKTRSGDGAKSIVLVGDPDLRDTTPLRLLADPAALAQAESERKHQEWLLSHTQGEQPDSDSTRGAYLRPLPGAHAEALSLKAMFEQQGWSTELLAKEQATEPALYQAVSSPRILHLAMHGTFQDEIDLGQEKNRLSGVQMMGDDNFRQRVALKNPMNGSYLALAAAQTTLNLWSRGQVPPLRYDGVFTAAEAASLKLEGTLLVTLSACESGLGRAQSGEGVLGLQRGFALAGAENLLVTLWPIGDGSTGEFMKSFYQRVLAGEHPAHALPQVQRELLVKVREEKGLWHAVNQAAPFTLMANTALPAQR